MSGGTAAASPSCLRKFVFISLVTANLNCAKKKKKKKKMTHIFFFSKRKKRRSVGFSFCFLFFKICCVWMKLACNHTDHKERKYSVLPFNPVMAYKQNGVLWSRAHKSSEKEIVLHTTSTTFPSFSGEGERAVVAGDTVRSRARHKSRVCSGADLFELHKP